MFLHRQVTMLNGPGQARKQFGHQPGERERGHPHRVDGEEQEPAFRTEQRPAIGQQPGQMFFEPPDLSFRPASELGRIEDNPVVMLAAPHFARGELGRIVDDPAHRALGHAG